MIMNLIAWDPIDKKMGVVETYHPKTGKVMFENDSWDWYKRDRIVRRPTGLKDRNCKELFEGDLVIVTNCADENPIVGVVEWLHDFWNVSVVEDSLWTLKLNGYVEVIGNIYEHSHLLEEESA